MDVFLMKPKIDFAFKEIMMDEKARTGFLCAVLHLKPKDVKKTLILNPYIDSAYRQLQVISQDKQKRMEYEAREKAVRDYNQSMYEAEQRGILIGERNKDIAHARSMKQEGITREIISKITGLSSSEIDSL